MSSEPYTPEETILRDICVTSMRMDGIEFDRLIAKIKADALREAVEEFESHVGAGEFEEQTCRNGTHWTHAVESWDHQGPFMHWLLNRADRIESGGGA